MNGRPIQFSAEMVRAILDGRKTQTRRVIKPQFNHLWGSGVPRGKRQVTGAVKCPVCNAGEVSYSIAYNGHIHAKCNTDKCVSWIE